MWRWSFDVFVGERVVSSPYSSAIFDSALEASLGKAPILWPPDAKTRLIGKDPDAGKD